MQAASRGTWHRPRCSASKRGPSPPEPVLLRDLEPALWGTESTAALHQYLYMNGVPRTPEGFLTVCTFLWRLGTAQELDLYSLPLLWLWLWDWRRKSFLTLLSGSLPPVWVMVTVENTESHCCVFVTLRSKSASSCPCGFHRTTYNQKESKIKSPTNTARSVVKCLEQK